MNAKQVILTAISFKGIAEVRRQAAQLADDSLCSKAYVLNIVRQVEKGEIKIKA